MALASPKTPKGVFWSPTARHSKKAWIDMPACKIKGLKLSSLVASSSDDLALSWTDSLPCLVDFPHVGQHFYFHGDASWDEGYLWSWLNTNDRVNGQLIFYQCTLWWERWTLRWSLLVEDCYWNANCLKMKRVCYFGRSIDRNLELPQGLYQEERLIGTEIRKMSWLCSWLTLLWSISCLK